MNPPPAQGLATRLFLGPALRTQPDRRLVTLVRDGYDTAFEEIVRRYGKALTRYAGAIVGGRSEDVTQDAFSKALLALRRDSDAEIDLKPWLYRIVRNTALNDLRDQPPDSAELVEEQDGGGRSAAEEAERREEIAELMRRLGDLPEPQRAAIVMRELEGLSHAEIAAALGLSGGGARQTIYRARQALRDGLGLMIPLPLMRMLIEHGAEAGVAAAGAGGAVAVGGAGAGTALKVGVLTAVLAGSVGTGLAIKDSRPDRRDAETAAAATVLSRDVSGGGSQRAAAPGVAGPLADGNSGGGDTSGDGRGPGSGGSLDQSRGESGAGPGSGSGTDGGGSGSDGDRHSGPGPSGDGSGHGGGPGPSQSGSGSGDGGNGASGGDGGTFGGSGTSGGGDTAGGSGSSGSGSDGGGGTSGGSSSSGDGSGTSGGGGSSGGGPGPGDSSPPPPPPAEVDSSGSGSSGSGSSGSGSDTSGSGSGTSGSGSLVPETIP
jgi:RNA polymerase sigma factor (sigma-70 family)